MKINCWMVRNNVDGHGNYHVNLSSTKPVLEEGGYWTCYAKDSLWAGSFCAPRFHKRARLKLPLGGIMPITLDMKERKIKKARKKK